MTKLVLLIAFILFMVIIGPVALIWSLNTLFPVLAIPYSFETWVAALVLGGVFKTTVSKS